MKELELRRLIPLAAAASLVTVGCGPSSTKIAKQTCKLHEECSKAEFDEEFDSISECVEEYEEDIDDYVEYISEEYGEACADALLDFTACAAKHATCDYDYEEIEEKCEDDFEELVDECGENF